MQVKFQNSYPPVPLGVVPVKKDEKISKEFPKKSPQQSGHKKSTNKPSQESVSFPDTLSGNVDIKG